MQTKALLTLAFLALPLMASAQKEPKTSDDFGIWTDIAAQKKLSKKASVELEAEYRTADNLKQNSRWSVGLSGEYKLTKWLKAGVGYTFLYNHTDKYTYHDEDPEKANYGKVNKLASYWGPRHRVNVDITGGVDLGNWKLDLRERWQYTYRPEKTVAQRYDFDDEDWDGKQKTYSGKGKNVLRSRLQVSYDKKGLDVEPYANVELYNGWSVEKVRYTVGLDWTFIKGQKLGVYYRYQDNRKDDGDGDSRNMHILGLSYKVKF